MAAYGEVREYTVGEDQREWFHGSGLIRARIGAEPTGVFIKGSPQVRFFLLTDHGALGMNMSLEQRFKFTWDNLLKALFEGGTKVRQLTFDEDIVNMQIRGHSAFAYLHHSRAPSCEFAAFSQVFLVLGVSECDSLIPSLVRIRIGDGFPE